MTAKINFRKFLFRQSDAINVVGYISKYIIANSNFSLYNSAKIIAKKARTKVEF